VFVCVRERERQSVCVCVRVSRPRCTGSVGDSVGEGANKTVWSHSKP
jgi:hypothetical protein